MRWVVQYIIDLYERTFKGELQLPPWLTRASTTLLPKNNETKIAKNYRPIACQNLMYKLYTGCINTFLQDHCEDNGIVTTEQAGGKKEVWGCLEQLLINKTILEEVSKHRRDLVVIWLDYQKAFDSIPHSWLIEALRLAKIPEKIIDAIDALTKCWSTNLHLHSETEHLLSDVIEYLKGIFQGDTLSVILFILSVNPLSFMLNKLKGYNIGTAEKRDQEITHLFFVDDLKLYAASVNAAKLQLDLVTQFSKDIGMNFGESKCAYLKIERGKIVHTTEPLNINGLNIQPIKDGESYKYLGIDESISYNGPVNKERVCREYLKRVRKIWSSELSAYNKYVSHNAFAVPVIIPTFGILDWTSDELKQLDIKTRKMLTMTGSFHRNSDVDKLYIPRKLGGRGLKSLITTYECRIISIKRHLIQSTNRNKYITKVIQHEQDRLMRVADELINRNDIDLNDECTPRQISQKYLQVCIKQRKECFVAKPMHGYITKQTEKQNEIDQEMTKSWTSNKYLTSHFEGYAFAINEQEINTKDLQYRRDKKSGNPTSNNKCRLCKYQVEDITHVISSCPKMSIRYYLPMRHDVIGKAVYESLRKKLEPGIKIRYDENSEFIYTHENIEYWWNLSIKTASKVRHNKPDMIVWDTKVKSCKIVEFSCPADVNVVKKVAEKENIYGPLIRNMQLMYKEYKFSFIPIIVGALGTIPKCLNEDIQKLGFTNAEAKTLIKRLQILSITGTVKICKTFMNFSV